LKSATGSGKSFTTASLVENFKRNVDKETIKVLISVPNPALVSQLEKDFKEYGVAFSYSGWTGAKKYQNTEIVIVNDGMLRSKTSDKSWFDDIDLVIVDECHRLDPTSKIYKIISKIKTPNKFALTGTLPPNIYNYWKLVGLFGPVLYEKNSKDLRDEKVLTDLSVKIIKLIHPKKTLPKKVSKTSEDWNPLINYLNELDFIYNSDDRNSLIQKIVSKLNDNTLILVNHLDHGSKIFDKLSLIDNKKVFFIKGEVELDDRETIQNLMENANDIICVAMSSIFATGINIKNIHNIIFACGGKSFVRIVQGIGRGLSLHENKDKLIVFDIADNSEYSERHLEKRQSIYTAECMNWKLVDMIL